MQLSQGHLNVLDYCPRRFQHTYLDQLTTPLSPDQQDAIATGQRFHTLMQQRELGLPLPGTTADLDSVYHDVERFLAVAPEVLRRDRIQFRQSEHRRALQRQGFLIIVVYDLLILEENQAEILDWKTHWRLPNPQALEQDWQQKLYPYVLAETSSYAPDQILMTYWFVRSQIEDAPSSDPKPKAIRFPYSRDRHHQIDTELNQRLAQLKAYLARYETGRSLPKIDVSEGRCAACPFAVRCHRVASSSEEQPLLPTLTEIDEVSI